MFYKYFYQYFVFLTSATFLQLTIFSILFSIFSIEVWAEKTKQFPEPPSGNGTIRTTIGGAGRSGGNIYIPPMGEPVSTIVLKIDQQNGGLPIDLVEQKLATLIPPDKFGLTVSPSPEFFAYVPKTSAIAIEFVIENQKGQKIDQQKIILGDTPSIIKFQLPTTKPLEVGKDYKWAIALVNKTGKTEGDLAEGIIRRVVPNPDLIAKLGNASDIDRVFLYGKFGIWHEFLTELVKLRLSQPSNEEVNTLWLDLLKSSNLESLANIPLK
jgi:hypothetical protein